jgi:hypothetical protein
MDTSILSCAVCVPSLIRSQWLEWTHSSALPSCTFMQSLASAIDILPPARHMHEDLLTDREDNEHLKHVLHENEPCDRVGHSVARYSKLY